MKTFACLLFSLVLVAIGGYAYASQEFVPVLSQGETFVQGTLDEKIVQIKIVTHEIDIGKPSDKRPDVILSSCTYSRCPCSLVDRIEISIGHTSLFIPRSVFCNLSDLNKASVSESEDVGVLTLYGGDASESYIVKMVFDASRVKRRVIYSSIEPNKPLEETTYHIVTIGD